VLPAAARAPTPRAANTTVIAGGAHDPALNLDDSDLDISGVTLTGEGTTTGDYAVLLMSWGSLYAHDVRIADVVTGLLLNLAGVDVELHNSLVYANSGGRAACWWR